MSGMDCTPRSGSGCDLFQAVFPTFFGSKRTIQREDPHSGYLICPKRFKRECASLMYDWRLWKNAFGRTPQDLVSLILWQVFLSDLAPQPSILYGIRSHLIIFVHVYFPHKPSNKQQEYMRRTTNRTPSETYQTWCVALLVVLT